MRRYLALPFAFQIAFPSALADAQSTPPQSEQGRLQQGYEQRIAALEARLKELEAARSAERVDDDLEALIREAEAAGPPPVQRPTAQQSILNPKISVIPDFTALFKEVSGDESARAAFGELFEEDDPFSLRSVDVEFRAAVAPDVDAVAVLGVGEEEAAFEEAYVVMHALPWELQAKVGRFKLDFGRMNRIHNHDLPQVDRPLVHQLLFGGEGTSVEGVSLTRPLWRTDAGSWIPTWSDLTLEVFNAANEESPLFGTDPHQEVAAGGRWKNFWQLDDHSDLELGASGLLVGDSPDSEHGESELLGADVMWRRKDPVPGSFADWLVQAEVIGGSHEGGADEVDSLGGYLTIQRRLDQARYLGVRFDSAESPFLDDADVWGISPYLTWHLNEFLRLRLQYQYLEGSRGGDSADAHALGLQLTWVFGAHPPEPYWVNK